MAELTDVDLDPGTKLTSWAAVGIASPVPSFREYEDGRQ